MASPTTAQEWRDFEDRYREWHLKVFHEYPPPVKMQASDTSGDRLGPTPIADAPKQNEQAGDAAKKEEKMEKQLGEAGMGGKMFVECPGFEKEYVIKVPPADAPTPSRSKPGPKPKGLKPDPDCFESFNTSTKVLFDATKRRPVADVAYVFKTERLTIPIEPDCATVEDAVIAWANQKVREVLSSSAALQGAGAIAPQKVKADA